MKNKLAPSPDQIRAAREAAKLSQSEAAELVGATRRTWQNWESAIGSGNHRAIDPRAWRDFEALATRAVEAFERLTSPESILASVPAGVLEPGQCDFALVNRDGKLTIDVREVVTCHGARKVAAKFGPTRKETEAAERFFNSEGTL